MAAFPGRRVIVLVVAASALGAGCAGSGYTYHSNRAEQLYFKVPNDWTVFDSDDLLPEDVNGAEVGGWVRGFAGGTRPSPDAVRAITHTEPRGYVEVQPLDIMERDALSLATLRGTNFGTDPITFAQERPDVLRILAYDDVVLKAGPHGVHIRVSITPEGTDDTAIIDQTVLVDKATTRRYVLSIGCNVACWDSHERQIREVIESWTLEAT